VWLSVSLSVVSLALADYALPAGLSSVRRDASFLVSTAQYRIVRKHG